MTGRSNKSVWMERLVRDCADEGLSRSDTAAKLGVSYQTVVGYSRKFGIEFRHGSKGVGVDTGRAEAMASMYRAGKLLEEIAQVYGISRERVRQIITKEHGLTGRDGGHHAKAKAKKRERIRRRDEKAFAQWGCSYSQYRAISKMGAKAQASGQMQSRNPVRAFASQRSNARRRGVEWSISFWDWWSLWQASGKWDQRGRGTGYMMCRFGDVGAYEVGNVYIATGVHNGTVQPNNPYRRGHPDFAEANTRRCEKLRTASRKCPGGWHRKYTDLPLGVTRHNVTGNFQAQITIEGRNTYLGTFKTVEDASAAYQVALAKRDALSASRNERSAA